MTDRGANYLRETRRIEVSFVLELTRCIVQSSTFAWDSNGHRMRGVVLGLVIVGRRQWATKDLEGDVDINRRESWRAVVLSCPNGPLMSLIALVTALRDT